MLKVIAFFLAASFNWMIMPGDCRNESFSNVFFCLPFLFSAGVNDYQYHDGTSLPQYYTDARWAAIRPPPLSSNSSGKLLTTFIYYQCSAQRSTGI